MPHRARKRRQPADAGKTVELLVESLGARGDGIASHQGRPVYLPLTVPDDRVTARLDAPRGDGTAAEVINIVEPGPARATPPCPYYGACGGCQLQHMATDALADWKRARVADAVARAGYDPAAVAPTVAIPPGSRRRAVLAVAGRGKALRLGFHRRRAHAVEDVASCLLLTPRLDGLLRPLRQALADLPMRATQATLLDSDGGVDLLLAVAGAPGPDVLQDLAAFAAAQDLARLSLAIDGGPPEPVAARRAPTLRFGATAVALPPGAFIQPSAAGEAALRDAVLAGVPEGTRRAADLYAGCGTFSFALAECLAVHAVEGDAAAWEALDAAARTTTGVSVAAERRDLARRPLLAAELDAFDLVVFDPPRAGAKAQAAEIAASVVPAAVAVSCNPATFARDARLLHDGGFRLLTATPVDQFPWSAHVELAAVFRR